MNHINIKHFKILCLLILIGTAMSCKKWVIIDDPTDTLTTSKMFKSEQLAESALAGVYHSLAQGPDQQNTWIANGFAAGLSTLVGGISANEFYNPANLHSLVEWNIAYSPKLWTSSYDVIYLANEVIEGLAASSSAQLRDSVKKQYTAEAKLLRAFSYLYLTEYFGDVPLVITSDFNKTKQLARAPKSEVFTQICSDLTEAYNNLPSTYAAAQGSRLRVNKWTAAALLARANLYVGNFQKAASYATDVIDQTQLFHLEPLQNVFLYNSQEAIFQLVQSNQDQFLKNGTIDGRFIPNPLHTGLAYSVLSDQTLKAFEPGDQRFIKWVDSTDQSNEGPPTTVWFPYKYKVGGENASLGGFQSEYYMVIRLAEMYLIRAEACAKGAEGGPGQAVKDLNTVRQRASLPDLPGSLNGTALMDAVWHERQVELFAEFGHRWFDLIRSGNAESVLSSLPSNQPWLGDWQLLYPIPVSEIRINKNLVQNPGYDQIH